jgi:lipoprotein-releasing system permease protein
MRSLTLSISLSYLLNRRRQTLVSVGGVAMGVAFFIALASMMQGFQAFFLNTVVDVAPHITIEDEYRNPRPQAGPIFYGSNSALDIQGIRPRDDDKGIRGYRAIVDVIEQMDEVQVAEALDGQIFLRNGATEYSASVMGIDPKAERNITRIEKDMSSGNFSSLLTAANGIILGSGVAKKLGATVGDSLIAVSAKGVSMRVKVVGLLDTGVTAIDKARAYMLLKKVQILQDQPNRVSQINLRLKDPNLADAMALELEQRFKYRAVSWREANGGIFGVFVIQNVIMYSTTGAIMIVAAFGIFNIISTIIHEKSKDIAILRSLGFLETDIQRIFVCGRV